MIFMPPLQLPERVICSLSAAAKYQVPAPFLLAVAEQENGKPGQWVKNTNGSEDVGVLQFNTIYLKGLRRYGITADDVAQTGCYPYQLAAWRIHQHLEHDRGDIWTRVADYHSYTPKYNTIYRAALIKKSQKWQTWLRTHFTLSASNHFLPIAHAPNSSEIFLLNTSASWVKVNYSPSNFLVAYSAPISTKQSRYNVAAARALAAEFLLHSQEKNTDDSVQFK
jgi:hypothetical protein